MNDQTHDPLDQEPPECSFCFKPQHEVIRLFDGPTAQICNECVELCAQVFREQCTKLHIPDSTDDSVDAAMPLDIGGSPATTTNRRRGGYWRNVWTSELGQPDARVVGRERMTLLSDGMWLGRGRWPSHEIAEQKAIESMEHNILRGRSLYTWLGAIWLPGRRDRRH